MGTTACRSASDRRPRVLVNTRGHLRLMGIWLVVLVAFCIHAAAANAITPGDGSTADSKEPSGDYIVVLNDSIDRPGEVAEAQIRGPQGELHAVYRHALKGYAATLPRDEIEALRRDPRVAYVTEDHEVTLLEEEVVLETDDNEGLEIAEATVPTGVNRTSAPSNKGLYIDGKDDRRADVDVAVIDTGIDFQHPDLDVERRASCLAGSCVENSGVDGNSHGTHVAGTIGAIDNAAGVVGMAPGARMWAVKVLSDGGSGAESRVIAGVDWVTAHANEIEVANMSLGCLCAMFALDKAVTASVEAGVVYAVAAGNNNTNASSFSPASNPNVIAVSALADYDGKSGGVSSPSCQNYGLDDRKASFSNYGSAVDIVAPGACILSTLPGNKYGLKSGTSMAAPHVAGAAAILATQSNPATKKDTETIRETLRKNGSSGWTDTSGDGIKEPLLSVGNEEVFRLDHRPVVTTSPASTLRMTQATLNAVVDPNGLPTIYRFEYGQSLQYGSTVPVSYEGINSTTQPVSVSKAVAGLSPNVLYHFRVVAENPDGITYGKDEWFVLTMQSALANLPVTEPFNGSMASVWSFYYSWPVLGWATGTTPKGESTSTGWRPVDAYPNPNGAFYKTSATDPGTGVGVVATMSSAPASADHYFSVWLDMSTPGSVRDGYELKFTLEASGKYFVALSKWVKGSRTVLIAQPNFAFAPGSSFALADRGGQVSVWTKSTGNFVQSMSVADATFGSGYSAIEGSGTVTRLTNFKFGQL
jgi:subtilisin family serine protease